MLLTCHSAGVTPDVASRLLTEALGDSHVVANESSLTTAAGRKLPAGVAAHWPTDAKLTTDN